MPYQGRQPGVGVRSRFIYTATGGQTTFSGADSNGKTLAYQDGAYVDVYLNGVMLVPTTDFTATTKTSITLTSGATASDVVEIVCYDIASMADTVSKSQGGTFDNDIAINGDLTVDTNTLFVDAANNQVGIGVTDMSVSGANAKLAVAGGVLNLDDTQAIAWGGGTGRPSINGVKSTGFLNLLSPSNTVFSVNNTERMRIDSSGNVGIGLTNPGVPLHVKGPTNGNVMIVDATGTAANYIFDVRDDNTSVMRVDPSGNLLVGTTNPDLILTSGQHGCAIRGAIGFITANRASDSSAAFGRTTTSGSIVEFYYNGVSRGSISTNGTTVSYNTSSDYRLKENVVPLAGAADRLAQIPVHRFNFIADPDRTVDGFLAHEVQEFVPEAVTGEKDQVETVEIKDEDGNVTTETRPVYQGIDQSKLVPLLTAALQEALAEIADLKARVAALEA